MDLNILKVNFLKIFSVNLAKISFIHTLRVWYIWECSQLRELWWTCVFFKFLRPLPVLPSRGEKAVYLVLEEPVGLGQYLDSTKSIFRFKHTRHGQRPIQNFVNWQAKKAPFLFIFLLLPGFYMVKIKHIEASCPSENF